MTDREAMKLALEALEMLARYENPETRVQVRKPKDGGPIVTMYPHKVAIDAADVLRTAIAEAEKQEPVADKAFEKWWDEEGSTAPKHRLDCEEHCYQIAKIAWSNGAYKAREAYTAPLAAPVQKPIEHLTAAFRALAPHCTMHDIARFREVCRNVLAIPPAAQRQWVEPTDEEIDDIYQGAGSNDLKRARAIGTLYKEKNA